MKSNKKSIGINTVADLISQKWCNDTSHPRCSSKNLLLPQLSRGGIYAPLLEAGRAFWLLWLMEQEGSDITLLLRLGHKKPTWLFSLGTLVLETQSPHWRKPRPHGEEPRPTAPSPSWAPSHHPATTCQPCKCHLGSRSSRPPSSLPSWHCMEQREGFTARPSQITNLWPK